MLFIIGNSFLRTRCIHDDDSDDVVAHTSVVEVHSDDVVVHTFLVHNVVVRNTFLIK